MIRIITPKLPLEVVGQAAAQANSLACLLDAIPFFPPAERQHYIRNCINLAAQVSSDLTALNEPASLLPLSHIETRMVLAMRNMADDVQETMTVTAEKCGEPGEITARYRKPPLQLLAGNRSNVLGGAA